MSVGPSLIFVSRFSTPALCSIFMVRENHIKLDQKLLKGTNSPAYFSEASMTAKKKFYNTEDQDTCSNPSYALEQSMQFVRSFMGDQVRMEKKIIWFIHFKKDPAIHLRQNIEELSFIKGIGKEREREREREREKLIWSKIK
jgi:hypothetical protein